MLKVLDHLEAQLLFHVNRVKGRQNAEARCKSVRPCCTTLNHLVTKFNVLKYGCMQNVAR